MKGQFKVTNITAKTAGVDIGRYDRTATETVGHPVSFQDQDGKPIMLQQGQVTIVSRLDSGLLNLRRGGFVRIEEVKDFADVLGEHAYKPSMQEQNAATRRAKAVPMGQNFSEDSIANDAGAVNPDGEPNFVAKAAPSRRTQRASGKGGTPNATKSRNNPKSK